MPQIYRCKASLVLLAALIAAAALTPQPLLAQKSSAAPATGTTTTSSGAINVNVVNTPLPVTGAVTASGTVSVKNPTDANGNALPLSVRPGKLITLRWDSIGTFGATCSRGCFRQLNRDGSLASSAFNPAAGQILVVTDVAWVSTISATPGTSSCFSLFSNTTGAYSAYFSCAVADSNGFTAHADHLGSGFAFPISATVGLGYDVWVYGYLTTDN